MASGIHMELGAPQHVTFESIDGHVTAATENHSNTAIDTLTALQRLAKTYAVVRPILVAFTFITFIPLSWREALRLFVLAIDEATTSGDLPVHALPVVPGMEME
jgi:hypothetical protein